MEPTKHNLRLMVMEDVLHYHPECKGLVEPSVDAATAMAVLVSAERGTARAPSSPTDSPTGISSSSSGRVTPSSKEAPAAGSLTPPPAAKSSTSKITMEDLKHVIAEDGQNRRQQAIENVEGSRVPITANARSVDSGACKDDDGGSQEEPAWPPKETERRPGWAWESGDGDFEEREVTVVLPSVAVGRSGGGSRIVKPKISRFEGDTAAGGSGGGYAMFPPLGTAGIGDTRGGGGGDGGEDGNSALLGGVQGDENAQE